MNFLVLLPCLFALALTAPTPEQSVHVTQDTAGNYDVAVVTNDFSKFEKRLADGTVLGEYSFNDPNGVLQTFKYRSGINGFEILDGPLPVAPVFNNGPATETPEVRANREQHLALFGGNVAAVVPVAPSVFAPIQPSQGLLLPVQETPEVLAARREHFAAHAAARALVQ